MIWKRVLDDIDPALTQLAKEPPGIANPCDGMRENFDLVYEKPVEKKPVPAQPKRS